MMLDMNHKQVFQRDSRYYRFSLGNFLQKHIINLFCFLRVRSVYCTGRASGPCSRTTCWSASWSTARRRRWPAHCACAETCSPNASTCALPRSPQPLRTARESPTAKCNHAFESMLYHHGFVQAWAWARAEKNLRECVKMYLSLITNRWRLVTAEVSVE